MPAPLAAVLATGEPTRLYSGLSVLVSTAVDGVPCSALATFKSLELLLDPPAGEEKLSRSLRELIATARELPTLAIYACAASTDTMELDRDMLERSLDGVMSTPRFLREAGDARLIFV